MEGDEEWWTRKIAESQSDEEWQESEMDLYVFNDYDVYSRLEYLIENYAKKWKKGTYDPAKAAKGIVNLILPAAITKIRQADPSFKKVSKASKEKVAKDIEETIRRDYLPYEGGRRY